jgi:hypothetical protein
MKTAFALVAAFASTAFAGTAVTQVELRASVIVQQAEVRLGDIAEIRSADLQAIRQLVVLPLGRGPAAGMDAVIRREALERWVRLRLGLARSQIEWRGAPETWLHTPSGQSGPHPAEPGLAHTAPSTDSGPFLAGKTPSALVARGDWVLLRFKSAGVELETRAQVLQDGRAGDAVRVRAWSASEPVYARVISASAVEATP